MATPFVFTLMYLFIIYLFNILLFLFIVCVCIRWNRISTLHILYLLVFHYVAGVNSYGVIYYSYTLIMLYSISSYYVYSVLLFILSHILLLVFYDLWCFLTIYQYYAINYALICPFKAFKYLF